MGNDAVGNARSCHLCLGNRRVGQEKKECTTDAFLPLRCSLNVIDHSPVKKTPCSCDGRRLDVPAHCLMGESYPEKEYARLTAWTRFCTSNFPKMWLTWR